MLAISSLRGKNWPIQLRAEMEGDLICLKKGNSPLSDSILGSEAILIALMKGNDWVNNNITRKITQQQQAYPLVMSLITKRTTETNTNRMANNTQRKVILPTEGDRSMFWGYLQRV